MKPKMMIKLVIDIAMTISLLLLMGYEMVGQTAHEWIGAGMFVLFILHHILNLKWTKNLNKGQYTTIRILHTVTAAAVFAVMVGLMVSGIMLSRHVFRFMGIRGGRSFARTLHLICNYWGFVLMSLHLGFHWNMMLGMARRFVTNPSKIRAPFIRCAGVFIAGYGAYAFVKRNIGAYMFLRTRFVFFDFDEPFILFLLDYAAIMGLFVWVGYYLSCILKKRNISAKRKNVK